MDLQGKVIVITGAAQGLGQKMAEVIAGHGAKLALIDVDHAKLQDTVRLCTKAGGNAKDYPADVTDEPAVEALFHSVHKDFGSVDGLINNGGHHERRALGEGGRRQGAEENVGDGISPSDRG